MSEIEKIIEDRAKTHGDYAQVAEMFYKFKEAAMSNNGVNLDDRLALAVEMIFLKLSRAICGDENHADHWKDIAGYAQLAAAACEPGRIE